MGRGISRDSDVLHRHWMKLSPEDQSEFVQLRNNFIRNSKTASKDRRVVAFRNELITALKYIEKNTENIEARCILTGICFCGPLIAVNNRQFKFFSGRCKSSINGSFQQLGYSAVKTKSKAKKCVMDLLPSLSSESQLIRQWTVRWATGSAPVCFVSYPKGIEIPDITYADLYDEIKSVPAYSESSPVETSPLVPKPEQKQPQETSIFAQAIIQPSQINPNIYNTPAPSMPIQQQDPNQGMMFKTAPHQYQFVQSSMQVPSQIQPVSCTFINLQREMEFIEDEEDALPPTCPPLLRDTQLTLHTSYSVDNFDENDKDMEGFFDASWCNPFVNSIRKSKSEMFEAPLFHDDILSEVF